MLVLKAIKTLSREQTEKGNIITCLEFQHAKTMSDCEKELLDPDLLRVFSFKGIANLISALSCLNKGLYSEFRLPWAETCHTFILLVKGCCKDV